MPFNAITPALLGFEHDARRDANGAVIEIGGVRIEGPEGQEGAAVLHAAECKTLTERDVSAEGCADAASRPTCGFGRARPPSDTLTVGWVFQHE